MAAALALRRTHPTAPALDLLDLVMPERWGSLDDLGAHLHPTTPFGQLIAAAFDRGMEPEDWRLIDCAAEAALVDELSRIWKTEVLSNFAARYLLEKTG